MTNQGAGYIKTLLAASSELQEVTDRINRQLLEFRNSRKWDDEPQKDVDVGVQHTIQIGELSYHASPEVLKTVGDAVTLLSNAVANAIACYSTASDSKNLLEILCDANATVVAMFEGAFTNKPVVLKNEAPGYHYSHTFNFYVRNYTEVTKAAVSGVVLRYPEIAHEILRSIPRGDRSHVFEAWFTDKHPEKAELLKEIRMTKNFPDMYTNEFVQALYEAFMAGRA